MIKKISIVVLSIVMINSVFAQKFFTKTGHVFFFSSTPAEDIEAHNYQVSSVLDIETGDIVFSMLMKGFEFEKALMQEHFNEKYVESDEYPKAKFVGKIENFESLDLTKEAKYSVLIVGELTIHGKTKEVKAEGIIRVKNGRILANSKFVIEPETFDIKIPSLVRENIAKQVSITVAMEYKKLEKIKLKR